METKRKETKKSVKPVDREVENTDIWLKALEDQDGLSDWEKDFIASVTDWFYGDHKLSPKQYQTLERIYRKFN